MKNIKKKMRIIILIIILLLMIFLIIFLNFPKKPLLIFSNGKIISLQLAKTQEKQEKGLMYIKELDKDSGMLFIYSDEQTRYFWMKNTIIPLDMIFIDKDNKIIDIQTAQPCIQEPCKNYISKHPAKYVLELNAGYAQENNINIGDKVQLKI